MPFGQGESAIAAWDGKIDVAGGRAPGHEGDDGSNVAVTEVDDPGADGWTTLEDPPTPRSGGASAVLGGKLDVLGGQLPGNTVYKAVPRFDPVTDAGKRWATCPSSSRGTAQWRWAARYGVPYAWKYTPP